MLIGLISDTHIPTHAKELPKQLEEVFRGVDLILHAGDIYTISVLDELERLAPVLAAEGDDEPPVTALDPRVKRKHILNLDGVTIWLVHEMYWIPPPFDPNTAPGVIVLGHTHQTYLKRDNGLLQVSPGSATFPRYRSEPGTVGLLTVHSGKADVKIIQLQ